eukprot:512826-Rhodomonas_salina.1
MQYDPTLRQYRETAWHTPRHIATLATTGPRPAWYRLHPYHAHHCTPQYRTSMAHTLSEYWKRRSKSSMRVPDSA